jgi:hypothetical protein
MIAKSSLIGEVYSAAVSRTHLLVELYRLIELTPQ